MEGEGAVEEAVSPESSGEGEDEDEGAAAEGPWPPVGAVDPNGDAGCAGAARRPAGERVCRRLATSEVASRS